MGLGKGSTQTQTTMPDAFTDQARRSVWDMAYGVANQPYQSYQGQRVAGVNPMTQQALGDAAGMYQDFAQWGGPQVGDVQSYANPHEQSVIGGVQNDFDRIRQQQLGLTDDMATRANAFGGSRHGIAAGTALGDVGRAEASQLGMMRQHGYDQAQGLRQQDYNNQMGLMGQRMQGAGAMTNFGLSGGGYMRNVEQAGLDAQYDDFQQQQNWGARNLGILGGTLQGLPQGSETQMHTPGNLFGDLMGLGAMGASFIPGIGPAAGAAAGGFNAQNRADNSWFI